MRKLKRKVFSMSILAILFVSLGFYASYRIFIKPQKQQSKQSKPLDSSNTTKFISQESIVDKIHETQKIIPLETDLEERILIDDSWGDWEVFKKVKEIVFYGKGSYSIDFASIDKNNIVINNSSNLINITLPKPQIEDIALYEDKTLYETTTNGLLRFGEIKLSPEENSTICKEVKDKMKEKMLQDDLYAMAESKSQEAVKNILSPLLPNSKTEIIINYQ
ncbi:DUF4230 domain-containing protein [Clostridium sp. 'White wine YQ']|uniref:DUF4230 domain-containing protein n=1 Tax=Clostridium sp. 'White wine YQ' TaxID=3027474 RepID=UPI0023667C07|nr:DUF4230 domain-containing protein [Clostridium sp. 'White wine YQ']MDD7796214.1 DUF4230 domain-containing protein [Clostridium sp. 'White wine YQ']